MAHEVVVSKAHAPVNGVVLTGGLLQRAFENNIAYLKKLSLDSILYWFRMKAGLPAPGAPYRGHFEDDIKGQTAGLFLMGAANSIRWVRDDDLARRVELIVDSIEAAAEPDGFFEPISKAEFGTKEYPNYVRVWLNYGLSAASLAGNRKALSLMRKMQSWFNVCDERFIAKHLALAFQGVIANTTVALSEVGLPEDLETVVNHYQEDWWLGQFIREDDGAVHKRPTPHGTELEAITAYMDMYRATGKAYYLNAVNAAYSMFQRKWQHVGGGIVAIEFTDIAPGCYWLDPIHKYNELCCSAHWLYLNQRYHHLFPDTESYVGEIEKTLYNIVVANQAGQDFIRYHAFVDIQKDCDFSTPVSCCAGLGTRILGSLPEFLYSVDSDGIFVDIYTDSEIAWRRGDKECRLSTSTSLPLGENVSIKVQVSSPTSFSMRLRVPHWVDRPVVIHLNGKECAPGTPGSYCALERTWLSGDTVTLTLPMTVRGSRYRGSDGVAGFDRYAYERGPLLLAFAGRLDSHGKYMEMDHDPSRPQDWAIPVKGKPGHYTVRGKPGVELKPYYEIQDEMFTCYPIFKLPDAPGTS